MSSKIAIVAGFLVAVGAIVMFTLRGAPSLSAPATEPTPSAKPQGGPAVHISLLYATEEKEWLQAAMAEYASQHPDVEVELIGKGSLDAAQAILDGKLTPTLWNPADTLVLEMLASDWETKNHTQLFGQEDDAPQPLLLTPLVFVVWEDRAQALMSHATGPLGFRAIHDAVASPRGWPVVGGKSEWGFVKLGHTDPTRSNSGLQTLLLMTLEYWNKREGLAVADLLDPAYQAFVRETERGVTRFEASTGTFMQDMVRFGPSKYDIAVVYENLAISQIENAQGRWGNLRVYYPATTLWSDHPIAILNGPWVTKAQRSAARAVVSYLRSHPIQQRALGFGFRPGDPSVPIRTSDAQNPYNRLAQFGLKLDVPPVAPVPEGAVIRNMMMMWSRVARPQ